MLFHRIFGNQKRNDYQFSKFTRSLRIWYAFVINGNDSWLFVCVRKSHVCVCFDWKNPVSKTLSSVIEMNNSCDCVFKYYTFSTSVVYCGGVVNTNSILLCGTLFSSFYRLTQNKWPIHELYTEHSLCKTLQLLHKKNSQNNTLKKAH